ncbi:DNA repair protein RadC [Citrobacter freundii]|nr:MULTISPECIES: JAB domain-containing protein [Gammaproteobacteria]EEA2350445.1 DNA repair protein RadC [Salmonella enterica subsp. enterica serovar Enteritidis]EEC4304223.1 DNA repair protein RadC [Salmonella enterica subsp. enterica serovar Enteritidis]EEN2406647.1 DNA repair protein RadC [Salmonella enterica subsp. enterica serovar Enteritidis]EES8921263.1 DNA repair protein RadC [Escherichia coli]EES9862671.1 DNA repair protein RadC [Escherichia coli]
MTEQERNIIKLAISILDRELKVYGVQFTNPDLVKDYLRLHLQDKEREYFGAMFLTTQNQLIKFEIIHAGSLNSVDVHPRQIAKLALANNANAVILVHNHPSYSDEPSRADIAITARIKQALELISINTLDHLIVAGREVVSLAEQGHL